MNFSSNNSPPDSWGENFSKGRIAILRKKLENVQLPVPLLRKVEFSLKRLEVLYESGNYLELEAVTRYIDWVSGIPFGKNSGVSQINTLEEVSQILNKNHYGLGSVKEKVLEFVSVQKLMGEKKLILSEDERIRGSYISTPVLLFIGIQGTGKTTMARSVAQALGRKFVRISLGGMASVVEIRGRTRGYPESEPGQVIKALVNTRKMNPVILFDEIDKVSDLEGVRSDIMAALLEILDPEQNKEFRDRYIDYPVDISKCIFIATANNAGGISSALLDRMEVIRFSSYSDDDKIQIAKNYLLPKILKFSGLGDNILQFSEDVWPLIIRPLGFDAGIRELERTLTNLARKVARKIVEGSVAKGASVVINKDNFREYIPEGFGVYS